MKKILVTQMMQKQGPRNHFRIVLQLLSCSKWSIWKISACDIDLICKLKIGVNMVTCTSRFGKLFRVGLVIIRSSYTKNNQFRTRAN